jgi:hypothetical protein
MSKTKLIVKEDQVLVDVAELYKEIEKSKGDWKKVLEEILTYIEEDK